MCDIAEVIQSPLFAKQKKKQAKKQRARLDEAVQAVMENPALGRAKSGNLQGIRIYKYKFDNNQILLAYEIINTVIYLYTFGSHQNFYREQSKYLHQQP